MTAGSPSHVPFAPPPDSAGAALLARLGLPGPVQEALRAGPGAAEVPAGWRLAPDVAGGWLLLETGAGAARPWAAGDRFGALHLAVRWAGADVHAAWFRLPGGGWLELRPRAGEHPLWGASDGLWHHPPGSDAEAPAAEGRPVGLLPAQDYGALRHLPPLDRPAGLPPGAGGAVLNFLALLLALQGTRRVTYRGPYPTPALFDTLQRSFVPEAPPADALTRFTQDETALAFSGRMMESPVGWQPAPFVASLPRPGLLLHWREGLETAWIGTVPFRGAEATAAGRPGALPAGERVWREPAPGGAEPAEGAAGGAWAVGLVLLGRPFGRLARVAADGTVLQADSTVLQATAPEPIPDEAAGPPGPALHPLLREVACAWSTLRAHPALAAALAALEEEVTLVWEPLPLRLAAPMAGGVRVQAALAQAFRARRAHEDAPALAAMLVSDLLEALEPHLRRLARQRLEAAPAPSMEALLAAGQAAQTAARGRLEQALPVLLAALARGEALPAEEEADQASTS